ncbi:MAG: FtsW/RodA/SpoVE family cell cycle protein, partial [Clostridiales Family XIII bacterium]|nr:FtsW/RodA/SpoVE family cell cycle protein [Clostridiales Family XIII bacterium]
MFDRKEKKNTKRERGAILERRTADIGGRKASVVRSQGDFFLFILVLGLVVFGVIMVFNASYYSTIDADIGPYYYLFRSAFWAAAGFVFMLVLVFVPYRVYYAFAPLAMVLGVVLLCAVFTPLG